MSLRAYLIQPVVGSCFFALNQLPQFQVSHSDLTICSKNSCFKLFLKMKKGFLETHQKTPSPFIVSNSYISILNYNTRKGFEQLRFSPKYYWEEQTLKSTRILIEREKVSIGCARDSVCCNCSAWHTEKRNSNVQMQ